MVCRLWYKKSGRFLLIMAVPAYPLCHRTNHAGVVAGRKASVDPGRPGPSIYTDIQALHKTMGGEPRPLRGSKSAWCSFGFLAHATSDQSMPRPFAKLSRHVNRGCSALESQCFLEMLLENLHVLANCRTHNNNSDLHGRQGVNRYATINTHETSALRYLLHQWKHGNKAIAQRGTMWKTFGLGLNTSG